MVFYDQFGGGRSERPAEPALWRLARFVAEVGYVRAAPGLDAVHLLGHSWGMMLAANYLRTQPAGWSAASWPAPC